MKKASKNKKVLFLALLALLVVGVGGFVYYRETLSNKEVIDNINRVDYGPPTEEEQKAGDAIKEELDEDEQQEPAPSDQKQNATVVITDVGQYGDKIEVRAFTEHYEDGTCTVIFTKGSESFSVDTPAYRDATTTTCTNPNIDRSRFASSGVWKVQITYESSKALGSSEVKEITIQ